MATYAEEQAARFAAEKKAREGQGFFDKLRRSIATDPVVTVKAAPIPQAPASSTRDILSNRGKSIDAQVDKAVGMKRGGKVKSKKGRK